MTPTTTQPRPSVHDPITKSYAIDQITDIEKLRAVAHRMWEAFSASHWQTAHAIADACEACATASDADESCPEWQAKQKAVHAGFGSI